MARSKLLIVMVRIVAIAAVLIALGIGIAFGLALAGTRNLMSIENTSQFDPEIPSKVLDINGRVITEFSGAIKRELVSIKDLPQHVIDALVAREDRTFWTHPGFTVSGYLRALKGVLTGRNLGGGSTITLQLAGTLYADRRDLS